MEQREKQRLKVRRLLSLALALAMVFSAFPAFAFAEGGTASGYMDAEETGRDPAKQQILVKVENVTFTPDNDPEGNWQSTFWYGTLVNRWVDIDSSSTMMSCLVAALEAEGYSQEGAENNYVSSIAGLGEFDGGFMSGWMGTLNDWMVNYGFDAFTVADGSIGDGDVINIMYTCDYGTDLGGTWDNCDTSVSAVSFSDGTLSPAFASDIYAYELSLGSDVTEVRVTPTAANKNYQVRDFVGSTEYKRTAMIPVENGTVITVKCGDPSWPSMNTSDGATTYEFTVVKEQPAVTVPVSVTAPNAASAKLFAAADTALAQNLLSVDAPYTANVPEGEYCLALYDDAAACLGTIMVTVAGESSFTAFAVTASCGNEGWICGSDYTVEPHVISGGDKASVLRQVTLGDGGNTFPCLMGDSVTVRIVPSSEKKSEGYAPGSATVTVTGANFAALSATCGKAGLLDVTYPYADADSDGVNDFILEVGQMTDYFVYSYQTDVTYGIPENGSVTAEYSGLSAGTYFIRVTDPLDNDAVTYGTYKSIAVGVNTVSVTSEQMYVGTDTNSDTVADDFSKNLYDVADLYLSVNGDLNGSLCGYDGAAGQLSLTAGDTVRVYPFRNWLAIESFTNSKVTEPDFHIQVVNLEGDPITVTENTENNTSKHSYDVSAVENGTAILLITYDAMTHDVTEGMGGFFSAIWPKNTGVIVVTVGTEGGIEKGMTINESLNLLESNKMAVEKYDAELDVLYFTGSEGASYSFKPEAGVTVTVSRGVIANGAMTFGAFTAEGVTVGEDGTVTITGLPEGKTIVKFEKDGKVSYQVLRAEQTDVVISDAGGNVYVDTAAGILNTDMAFAPGESVTVTYTDLYHPANKFSGFYNMNAKLILTKDGAVFASGSQNQYQFASTAAAHKVTFTIPADAAGTLTLGGTINVAGFGSYFGYHRVLTYEVGKGANMTAVQQNGYMGALPTLELPIAEAVTVSIIVENGQGEALTEYTLSVKDAAGSDVTVADGSFTAYPGKTYSYVLTAAGYARTVDSFTVPADAAGSYPLVLTVSDFAEGAWNGTASAEPEQLEGVYQIGTGAELAWFAAKINDGTAAGADAVLTADIELSNMDWTPIGSSSKAYAGAFDGQGYWIKGLYINNSGSDYQGLFGSVAAAGVVCNLGVSGTVTGKNRVAGIAANLVAGGQVLNCVNAASVNGTKWVAGVAAWVGANTAVVRNCYNVGTIIGNGQMVGGVTGGSSTTAQNCTIENCYNVGMVSANSKTYCGSLAGGKSVANKTVNNYYLAGTYDGTGSNCNLVGTAVSADELRALAATLGEAYLADENGINNGYPILTWQQKETEHVHELTATAEKAPTCEEAGNTAYWTCCGCGKYFADADAAVKIEENSWVIPALNHQTATKTLTFEGSSWNSLIDDPQYGGELLYGPGMAGYETEKDAYQWTDSGNTELFSRLSFGYGSYAYWSGGHAVSHYVSGEADTYGSYDSQLTVFLQGMEGLGTSGGGHNGSDNFAVHYGYADNSGWSLDESALPFLSFADGTARVIESMYVNNTCYAINCYTSGNGLTPAIGADEWVKIVATGYSGNTKTNTAEFYLCNGPEHIVTEWTKWDLSGLGKVTKVTFNVTGSSDNGYGFSQPAYFAYDDVSVTVECLKKVEEKVATCTEAGNTAYWYCTECGKFFADADASVEIEENSWVIPATGHVDENSDGICDVCEEKFKTTVDLAADKELLRKSETVTLTLTLSDDLVDITNFEYSVYFDPECFELKSSEIGSACSLTQISGLETDGKGSFYSVSFVDTASEGVDLTAGAICSLTFEALKETSEDTAAAFTLEQVSMMDVSWKQVESVIAGVKEITVTLLGHCDGNFDGICDGCGEELGTVKTAAVAYTSQFGGAYLHAPKSGTAVASNLAELYGYQDGVSYLDNVSALDVLVAAHIDVFGDLFTKETAADYLVMGEYGSPDKQFAIDSTVAYGGFFLNNGYANDGTESAYGGYNGTMVTTQAVVDGDLVEFFFYEDEFWGDTYNWFEDASGYSRSFSTELGSSLELTLKGFYASSTYLFKNAAEMAASESAYEVEDAQLWLVNTDTGALTKLDGAITDEDGKVTLTFREAGTYVITAYGTEDCKFTQILSMTQITVENIAVDMHSCSFNNNLNVNYYVAADKLGAFDDVYMTFEMEGKEPVKATEYTLTSVSGKLYRRYVFAGVAAAEMGKEISAVIHCAKNGSEFVSGADVYSVAEYAYSRLEKSTDPKMKALCVNLLTYGAAAQKYFNADAENPVDAALTEEQRALAYSVAAVSVKNQTVYAEKSVRVDMMTLVCGSTVDLKYYLTYAEDTDWSKVTFTVFYDSADGRRITVNYTGADVTVTDDAAYLLVTGIAAANLRSPVTLNIVEEGVRTASCIYNAESYCAFVETLEGEEELKELCRTMMGYSAAAEAYFAY